MHRIDRQSKLDRLAECFWLFVDRFIYRLLSKRFVDETFSNDHPRSLASILAMRDLWTR